jgi:hypothetical protein
MERIPAISGWHWIKQGFALFRRQPSELSTLFVMYWCLNLLLTFVPEVAAISWFMLTPIFSMAFMTACRDIEHDKRVQPKLLFAGFRYPTWKRLLLLGTCYLAAIFIAVLAANFLDDGYLFQAVADQINNPPAVDAKAPEDIRLLKSIFVVMAIYLCEILPLWFVAPLIAWRNLSVGKAIFFSIFSVIRAIKAIALYAVCWLLIAIIIKVGSDTILQLLGIEYAEVGLFFLMPLSLLMTIVMYCSYYASYTQIFGTPELPEPSGELLG